jgi:hypothetical protein
MTNSQELFRRAAALFREAVLLRKQEYIKAVQKVPKGCVKASCEQELERVAGDCRNHNYGLANERLDMVQAWLERYGHSV